MKALCVAVLCCLTVCLGGCSERDSSKGAAIRAAGWNGRRFYLTKDKAYQGNQALSACSSGYHMASFFEIFSLADLQYDTTLGLTEADSGFGPPTDIGIGWIRTGNRSLSSGLADAGLASCNVWTSNAQNLTGSLIGLSSSWGLRGSGPAIASPWLVVSPGPTSGDFTNRCNNQQRVWCVQD
jgi:hypothetical protein